MATTEAFLSLSDTIKEWISSEEVVGIINEFDVDFGIEGESESILPGLILRLVAQEIDPRHFVNEIGMALKVNYETAKKIAQRVDNEILKPIEVELGKAGTDTHQIFDYAEPPLKDLEQYKERPGVQLEDVAGNKALDSRLRGNDSGGGNDPVKSPSDHGAGKEIEPAPKIIQNGESTPDITQNNEPLIPVISEIKQDKSDENVEMDSRFRGNDSGGGNNPIKSLGDHGADKEVVPKIIGDTFTLGNPSTSSGNNSVEKVKIQNSIKKIQAQAPDNLPMKPAKEKVDRPFILHEEIPINAPQNKIEAGKSRPTFSYQPSREEGDEIKKPVKVEIEIGNGQIIAKPATNDMLRVVHYSNFYTGLTQPNLKNNKKDGEVPVPRGRWFL